MTLLQHPGWIAVGLSAIALLLVIGSSLAALRAANALRVRVEALAAQPIFEDLEALEYQTGRFATLAPRVAAEVARARVALETMRVALHSTGMPQAIASVSAAVKSARALARLFG